MYGQDRFWRVVLPTAAICILATVLLVGYVTEPDRFVQGFAPEQPIPFSHRLHAGDNHVPCLYCHTGATRSRSAMVPPVETCMNCHRVTRTDKPAIKQLAAAFESGKPIEWRRIYSLPDHVYFDHRPHVNGGIACQKCHGEVQAMERISQYMSLRMGACLACHRNPERKGPTQCSACHR